MAICSGASEFSEYQRLRLQGLRILAIDFRQKRVKGVDFQEVFRNKLMCVTNHALTQSNPMKTTKSLFGMLLVACLGLMLAGRVTAQTFKTLHDFAGHPSDGGQLKDSLFLSGNTLYGTTPVGGSSDNGTVFAVNIDGTGYTNLYNFTALSLNSSLGMYTNSDGINPYASVILSGNTLYGTTEYGGSLANGTVFAISTNGSSFTNLHNFPPIAQTIAGLVQSGNTLYGTEFRGGGSPEAGSVFLSGNTLYGTASQGGSSSWGTVFSLTLPGPQLTITLSETNIILTWPTNFVGYVLQSTVDLDSPPGFVDINLMAPPVVVNGQFSVTLPNTITNRTSYRLKHD
jgi:uncharacterized repeat protein (TIGR03803 family)